MYTLSEVHIDKLQTELLSKLCDEYSVVAASYSPTWTRCPVQIKRIELLNLYERLRSHQIYFEPYPGRNVSETLRAQKFYFYKTEFDFIPEHHKKQIIKAKAFLYLSALAFKYAQSNGGEESEIVNYEIKRLSLRSGLPENQLYAIWLSALDKDFTELKRPLHGARKFVDDYELLSQHIADIAIADGVIKKKEVWFYKLLQNVGIENEKKIDSKLARKLLKSHASKVNMPLRKEKEPVQTELELELDGDLIEDMLRAFEV